MSVTMANEIYTLEEAAKQLKVHPMTVRRAIDRGELKAFHIGSKVRIRREALEEFIRKQEQKQEE